MNEGAKYKFYVPADLAYGARSTGKITGHSTLIFEVELLEIIESGRPVTK
jgi:FKBP-type peptidyl-prolyl cis-trans isomerase FkpA